MVHKPPRDSIPRGHVVIFGGGVAGLSAAHELAERDFKVHVVESRPHPLRAGECLIGGMAATQWSRYPLPQKLDAVARSGMRRTRPPWMLDWEFNVKPDDDAATRAEKTTMRYAPIEDGAETAEIRFERSSDGLDAKAQRRIKVIVAYVRDYLKTHVAGETVLWPAASAADQAPTRETLYVEGFHEPQEDTRWAHQRAHKVADELGSELRREPDPLAHLIDVVPLTLDCAPDDAAGDPERARCVRFRLHDVRLPGEHGYRFFPSFYRHLFDVMKRTPIFREEPMSPEEWQRLRMVEQHECERQPMAGPRRISRTKRVETGRTVYDNLVETEYHSIEQADYHVAEVLPRRRPPSLVAFMGILRTLQRDLQFEWLDLARSALTLFKYLTSDASRREGEYQQVSWAEFVNLADQRFSLAFRKALDIWPQALVGMLPEQCDARTGGNATAQMLLDQVQTAGFRDGTLNASTSEAWLDHWRCYLESIGVVFHLGRLEGLEWKDGLSVRADVINPPLPYNDPYDDPYIVLALPPEEASRIVTELVTGLPPDFDHDGHETHDLRRLAEFLGPARGNYYKGPDPDGPFQHFNGVQYYLLHDFALLRGHTYYANSTWGLTSVSQGQFRVDRPAWRDPYRGIISVDIGAWSRLDERGVAAWDYSVDQVAVEIWNEMTAGVADMTTYLPWPLWYHFDEALQLQNGKPIKNTTPYLLTRPGDWEKRPGDLLKLPAVSMRELTVPQRLQRYGGFHYRLAFGANAGAQRGERMAGGARFRGLVLAGNYTKTFTRLGTMESANESARHAVNAILADWSTNEDVEGRVPQLCRYWNMEDFELADFAPLKQLDAKLFERGLPHFVDILELDRWLSMEWPKLEAAGASPATAFEDVLTRLASQDVSGLEGLGEILRAMDLPSLLTRLVQALTPSGDP